MDLISGADISWAISHIADPYVLLILIGGVTAGVLFGALPGIMNAAVDALVSLDITHIEMPLTPEKLWRTIRDARSNQS